MARWSTGWSTFPMNSTESKYDGTVAAADRRCRNDLIPRSSVGES